MLDLAGHGALDRSMDRSDTDILAALAAALCSTEPDDGSGLEVSCAALGELFSRHGIPFDAEALRDALGFGFWP